MSNSKIVKLDNLSLDNLLNEDAELIPLMTSEDEEEINKEEAERILNALKADEQDSQKKKAPVKASRRARGKDW